MELPNLKNKAHMDWLMKQSESAADPSDLLEKLAALEHEQWEHWSKAVADEVSEEKRLSWEENWVPYEQLDDSTKDMDREWAVKIMEIIEPYMGGGMEMGPPEMEDMSDIDMPDDMPMVDDEDEEVESVKAREEKHLEMVTKVNSKQYPGLAAILKAAGEADGGAKVSIDGEEYGDVKGSEPDAKDLKRLADIEDKSAGDEAKMLKLATNMASAIKDHDKAVRRAKAAKIAIKDAKVAAKIYKIFMGAASKLAASLEYPTLAAVLASGRAEGHCYSTWMDGLKKLEEAQNVFNEAMGMSASESLPIDLKSSLADLIAAVYGLQSQVGSVMEELAEVDEGGPGPEPEEPEEPEEELEEPIEEMKEIEEV